MDSKQTSYSPQERAITRWLLNYGSGIKDLGELVRCYTNQLCEIGIDVERVFLGSLVIHPQVAGEAISYRKQDDHLTFTEVSHEKLEILTRMKDSPIQHLLQTKRPLRAHLEQGQHLKMSDLTALSAEGYTDFLALPVWVGGQLYAGVTYCTRRMGGFTGDEVNVLQTANEALGPIAGLTWCNRQQSVLLRTYLGADAGARVHKGQVRRGDWHNLTAAIWFCDMRNFTKISVEHSSGELLEMINDVFEVVVGIIQVGGGQVLKFMGDALLAVFDNDDGGIACQNALKAAILAGQGVSDLAVQRRAEGKPATSIGIGLHYGEVSYGNIGSKQRLDFTVIGSSVNLTSRIEGLCGRLHRKVIMSEAFNHRVNMMTNSLGSHRLRGVESAVEVFGLATATEALHE